MHDYDHTTALEDLSSAQLAHMSERLDANHDCKIGLFDHNEILLSIECPFGTWVRCAVHGRHTVGHVYSVVESLRALANRPQAPAVQVKPALTPPVPLSDEEWGMLEHWIQAAQSMEWVRFKCARRARPGLPPASRTMASANLATAEEAYQGLLRRLAPLYHRMMPVA